MGRFQMSRWTDLKRLMVRFLKSSLLAPRHLMFRFQKSTSTALKRLMEVKSDSPGTLYC